MAYDPKNSNREPDLRTTPSDSRRSNSWVGWIAAVALVAIAVFALTQWLAGPDTDPQATASTSNSEPAPALAPPTAPADNNAAPAPATAPPAGTQQ
ncbi:hypothetical protein C9413_22765 [Rhizobium sp. SEMIA 4085]|uniref:Uncharacterized protein n=1 Tax=Rhizobium gallicum bv. gallicum R602sp TaxID=1041138 RepID=A0A0B4X7C8_9HYPH|nr:MULTISPECIES: hypothetical protein [Rhizobium]AJD42407.1 hypothetical protein RGR602_CH03090 [Rhizobium gallicum bv. gallicum R602sp]NNH32188.1 hypothetical protein [Rhizobium sp. SEMIA 4085]TDW16570.1 hypothetical protein EV128_13422 [Rhizobium azibense]